MGGRNFVRRSLETKDPREAARAFVSANSRFEDELDRARMATEARTVRDEISASRASDLVETFIRKDAVGQWERWPSLARVFWLEDLAVREFGVKTGGIAPTAGEAGSMDLSRLLGEQLVGDTWLETIRAVPRSRWLTCCRMVLDSIFEEADPPIIRTTANEAAVMDAFNGRVAADCALLHEDVGAVRRHVPPSRERPLMRLSELLELWASERRPAKQSEFEVRQSMADFIELYGDVAVVSVTRDMLLDYRDRAKRLPVRMPKADRVMPFSARLEKHSQTEGERISAATLKKRVSAVQSLLGLAHGEGWLATNVGARVPITGYSRAVKSRRSFRDGELKTLFANPIFVRPEAWFDHGTDVSDLTLAWMFLIGATSGARLEEVGQARLADVQLDAGVPIIDIDERAIPEAHGDGAEAKSLKNAMSRRVVPIHPRVLALGFMRYVDALRALGQSTVFVDLSVGQFGKRSKEASRRANRFIDAAVTDDPRLVYHSLRHKFKDEGRSVGIPDTMLDQMTGHSPATVGARYGEGAPIRVLFKQMARIKFAMIDWAPIVKAFSAVDWDATAARLVSHAEAKRKNG